MDERRPSQPTPTPEQTQPLQGRAVGRESLQEPTTFDGHEPDAWKHDSTIFRNRTLVGLKALREKLERVGAVADFVATRNQAEEDRQNTESGKFDRPFSNEDEIRLVYYNQGLRAAYNIIVQHMQGKPRKEAPQGGLSQGDDLKK